MNRSASWLCHGLIVGVLVLITLPIRHTLRGHYTGERRQIEAAGREQRTLDLGEWWNRRSYADIAEDSTADRFVAALHLDAFG